MFDKAPKQEASDRSGQLEEPVPAYVFVASSGSSVVAGNLIQVTGGKVSS